MEIIIIPGIFLVTLFLIGASFAAGFTACNRYHSDLRVARESAVEDYRAKEHAIFSLAQDEVDYYKRVVALRDPEIPLPVNHANDAHWSHTDNSVAFAGKKSQFR